MKMGVKRIYDCDLCQNNCEKENLIGLWSTYKGWVKEDVDKCEYHICEKCANSISTLWNQSLDGENLRRRK